MSRLSSGLNHTLGWYLSYLGIVAMLFLATPRVAVAQSCGNGCQADWCWLDVCGTLYVTYGVRFYGCPGGTYPHCEYGECFDLVADWYGPCQNTCTSGEYFVCSWMAV
jgi:hypothetical protein